MSKRKDSVMLAVGILVGTILTGPVAQAVTEHLEVQRSTQSIYVDGERVELEAYNINGANYVKLRDIGQAVDFEVYWDGEAVQIVSGQPYTGLPPVQPPTLELPDYSQESNPAIFTEQLTPAVYNTVREAVLTKNTTSFGSSVTGFLGLKYGDDEALFQRAKKETQAIESVLGAIGLYPNYQLVSPDGSSEYLCQVRYAENYEPVKEHTQSFIASLEGLEEREAIKRIAWYVCDRLTYTNTRYAWPSEVLTQDGVVSGACMSYAYSFKTLCDLADIPCILISSQTHQWNMVYAEGRWWDVDVTCNDCDEVTVFAAETAGGVPKEVTVSFDGTDAFRETYYVDSSRVLWDRSVTESTNSIYIDQTPGATEFAKELLVPGSTK